MKGTGGEKYTANKKLTLMQEDDIDSAQVVEDLSFLQVASVKNVKVFNFLKNAANSLKSTALTALTMKLKADHFVKVRQLIKDLINRLNAQAEAEATHKDMCDKEMKEATTSRDESQTSMESE